MVKKIRKLLKKVKIRRTSVLAIVFFVLSFILIQRLFKLQIIDGAGYAENFELRTTKERSLNSVRGNILDRNGKVLASNQLSYSVTLYDSGSYNSTRQKNLSLNSEALKIAQILEANGDSIDFDFHIYVDANDEYQFDTAGVTLSRFRADVYGKALIDDLDETQSAASAADLMQYLAGSGRFCLLTDSEGDAYTEEDFAKYQLPSELSKTEILKIITLRYALSTNSYQKYKPVTIATNVSEDSIATIKENQSQLIGVDVEEDSIRVYEDSTYFASLIGYTGKASSEELADLKDSNPNMDYSSGSVIGKAGIEQYMETVLHGTKGSETVYVDVLGKVLQVDDASRVEPIAGNDVYLTIDKELQIASYEILEQKIAGILVSNMVNTKTFDKNAITNTDQIRIAIYEVYYALINNNVIDTSRFFTDSASPTEQYIAQEFTQKQVDVFAQITEELNGDNPTPYSSLSSEMQEYASYIVEDVLMGDSNILNSSAIDTSDATYLAWSRDKSISLQEFLIYAASQNWIDISSISSEDTYLDSKEVYITLASYIHDYLAKDNSFNKLLYKYLLQQDNISGSNICQVLYDQGILDVNDSTYTAFVNGQMSPYDLMINKITNLEITPAQLALDPCSGSAVVTDPQTGEVLACVTYPGYDNNRLANDMDTNYYRQLSADLSEPFYNKATQQKTAPGSTFKLITTVAGMSEGVVTDETEYNCNGLFDLITPTVSCWYTQGHGTLNVVSAIQNSCNVFFSNVAYSLGINEEGNFSDSLALEKLEKYAKLFNMDQKSGIEVAEVSPQISDQDGIRSAIGQGTHLYTTSQLARYVSTLANSGTSFNLSLIDKTTSSDGTLLEDFTPSVLSQVEIDQGIWDNIHSGMRAVITENGLFNDISVPVSGKTGTAQEAKNRPSHGLFIGYAPSDNPEIAVAIRIAYGYSSTNAILAAKDIIRYHFDLADEANILTGTASVDGTSNAQTD